MASAPSLSFCNAAPPLRLPPHPPPSNVFSSCGTLEDMVTSCAGAARPIIQGPGSSMVNNRLDEVRGRKRIETAAILAEAGICRGGAGYHERGYDGGQMRGGRREEGENMQGGGGGGGGGDEEEEEEEGEEEMLAYEKQGSRWSRGGEEQGSMTWKKRKLSAEQVRCLERSFEMERKLEGQRKAELAVQLCLEPRQIAVWFQNRRARWKSKQLEHDYLALKASLASLQAHFDALLAQKLDLLRQVNALKSKLQQGDDPLKYDASMSPTYERVGIQKEKIDQEHEKLASKNIRATRETSCSDDTKRVNIEEKGDMATNKDKGGTNDVRNKLEEPSTLSSTDGSMVSEAINSPHAIESDVIDSQGTLINPSLGRNDVNSSFSSLFPIAHHPIVDPPPPLALGTLDLFNLNNEYIKVEPLEGEDVDTQHKYCFILEDHAEGAFPWWN